MRVETASQSKGAGRRKTSALPGGGTKARKAYDILFSNRGRPVYGLRHDFGGKDIGRLIEDLRDYYGCDIISTMGHNGYYLLAGEWFGVHYSDYVVQAIDQELLQARSAR